MDFDDLLLKMYEMLNTQPDALIKYQRKFKYIMIDEYQDTNAVQYKISKLLAAMNENICVVGDVDQSIYSWRGADISFNDITHLLWPAFLIALLCAIESLLSARVADGLVHVPKEKHYSPNRELLGQGLGTAIASLFGGMPATGAIARTSVNVRAGAKTRLAAVIHSFVLLFIALVAAPWVSQIPAAAIAGVLLGTSYRILNPTSLKESLRTTKSEATVLLVTAIATVAIDLIWGIGIGICLYFFLKKMQRR